ncbi:unnamed protein product [Gordionus sp. m RMFG-2023]
MTGVSHFKKLFFLLTIYATFAKSHNESTPIGKDFTGTSAPQLLSTTTIYLHEDDRINAQQICDTVTESNFYKIRTLINDANIPKIFGDDIYLIRDNNIIYWPIDGKDIFIPKLKVKNAHGIDRQTENQIVWLESFSKSKHIIDSDLKILVNNSFDNCPPVMICTLNFVDNTTTLICLLTPFMEDENTIEQMPNSYKIIQTVNGGKETLEVSNKFITYIRGNFQIKGNKHIYKIMLQNCNSVIPISTKSIDLTSTTLFTFNPSTATTTATNTPTKEWRDEICEKVEKSGHYNTREIFPSFPIPDSIPQVRLLRNGNEIIWSIDGGNIYTRQNYNEEDIDCYRSSVSENTKDQLYLANSIIGVGSISAFDSDLKTIQGNSSNNQLSICYYSFKNIDSNILCTLPIASNTKTIIKQHADRIIVSNDVQTSIDNSFIIRISGHLEVQGTKHRSNILLRICQDSTTISTTPSIVSVTSLTFDTKSSSISQETTISELDSTIKPESSGESTVSGTAWRDELCQKVIKSGHYDPKEIFPSIQIPDSIPRVQLLRNGNEIIWSIDGEDIYKRKDCHEEEMTCYKGSVSLTTQDQFYMAISILGIDSIINFDSNLKTIQRNSSNTQFSICYYNVKNIEDNIMCTLPTTATNSEIILSQQEDRIIIESNDIQKFYNNSFILRISGDFEVQGTKHKSNVLLHTCQNSTIEYESSGESNSTTKLVVTAETTPYKSDSSTIEAGSSGESTVSISDSTIKSESSEESTVSRTDSSTVSISPHVTKKPLNICQNIEDNGRKTVYAKDIFGDDLPNEFPLEIPLLRTGSQIFWSVDAKEIYQTNECLNPNTFCYKNTIIGNTLDKLYSINSIIGTYPIINFDSDMKIIQVNSSNDNSTLCYFKFFLKKPIDNVFCNLTRPPNVKTSLAQLDDSIVFATNKAPEIFQKSFILRTSGNFEVRGTKHIVNVLLYTCQDSTDFPVQFTTTAIDSTTKLVVSAKETTPFGSDSTIGHESSGESTVSVSDSTTKPIVIAKETTPFGSGIVSAIATESSGESTVSASDSTIKPVVTTKESTPFGSSTTIEAKSSGESTVSVSDTTTITGVIRNKTTPFGSGWTEQYTKFTTTSPILKDMCDVVKESGDYNIHQFFNEPKIPDTFPQMIHFERDEDRIIWNVDGNDIFMRKYKSRRISHVAEEQIIWLEGQSLNRYIDSNVRIKFGSTFSQSPLQLCRFVFNNNGNVEAVCLIPYIGGILNEAVQKDIDVSVEEIDSDGKILNNKTYPHSFITYIIGDFELSGDRHKLKVVFKICEENATETVIQTEETTPFGYEFDTKSDSPSQKTTISGSDYTTKPIVLAKETTPFGSGIDSTIEAKSSGESTVSVSDSTTISVIAKETTPVGFDNVTKTVIQTEETTPFGSDNTLKPESSGESTVSGTAWRDELCQKVIKSGQYDPKEIFPSIQISDSIPRVQLLRNGNEIIWSIDGEDIYKRKDCHEEEMTCYKGSVSLTTQDQFYMAISILGIDSIINFDSNLRTIQRNSSNTQFSICYYNVKNIEDNIMCTLPTTATNSEIILKQQEDRIIVESNDIQKFYNNSFILRISGDFEVQGTKHKSNMLLHTCQGSTDYTSELTTTSIGIDSTIEVESSGKSTVSISDSTTKLVVAAKETTPFGSESTIGDESSGESTVSISDTTIKPVITAMNTTPFGSGVDSTIESESSGESTVSISVSKDMCNVVKKSGDYNIHQFFNEPKIPDTFPQIIYLERVDDLIIWNVDGNDIFIKKDNSTRISHVAEEQILWLERQSLNRSIDSNNEAVQKDIDVSVEEIDNDGKILNNKTYPHSFITYLIGDFELSGDRHKLKVVFKMCEENATETVIQTEETTPFGYECDTKSDSPSQKTTISGSDYTTKPVVLAKETTPFGSGTDSTIEAESSGETTDSVSDSTTISVIAKETTPFGFDSTTKVVTSKKTTPTGSGIDSTEVESSGESTVSLSDSTTKVVVTSKETTPSGSGIDSTIEVESSGATVSVSDFTTKLVVTAKETPFGSSWTEQSTKFTTTSTILKDMCDIVKESGNYNIHQFFNEPKIPDSFPQMIYLERDDDRIIWNVDGNDIFMRKYKSSRISHVAEEQILWLERQSLNRSIDSNNEAVQKDTDVSVEEIDNDGKILNNKTYPNSFITYLIGDFELSGDRHKLKVVFKICEDETTSDTTTKSVITSKKTTNFGSVNGTETVIQTEETTPFGSEFDTRSGSPSQKTTIAGSDSTTKPVVTAKETTPFGSDSTIETESSGETTVSVSDSTTKFVVAAKETTTFGSDSTIGAESSGESTVSVSDTTTKTVVTVNETTPFGSGSTDYLSNFTKTSTESKTKSTTPVVTTAYKRPVDICEKIENNDWQTVYSKDILGVDLPNIFPEHLQIIKMHEDIMIKIDGTDIFDKTKNNSLSIENIESIIWLINQYPLHIKSNLVATMKASNTACPFTICFLEYNEIIPIVKCKNPLVTGEKNAIVQNRNAIMISQIDGNNRTLEQELSSAFLTGINGDLNLQGNIYQYIFTIKQCPVW